MVPNFDPAQDLPPELQTGPVTTPISMPSAAGNAFAGTPVDPLAQAIALQAQQNRFSTQLRTTPQPMLPMPAGEPVPELPQQQPVATPAAAAPLAAPAPTTAAPVAAPARHGGGSAQGDLEKDIVKVGKDQVQAVEDKQKAVADAADASAAATRDLEVQQRADAQQLSDRQAEVRARQAELDRQDAANLQHARDTVIPDFWAGAPGARVASIVSMAMGGIAQGILGGPNGAMDVINRQTDKYFQQQKEKIDNLYKYAELQGRVNNQTRLSYAQQLVDLKDQHAAVQQSILTHIDQVEKQNKGNIARADTEGLKAALQQDILKTRQQSRVERAHIAEMAAQTDLARANAEKSRAEAKVAGTLKIDEKIQGLTVRDPFTGQDRALAHSTKEAQEYDKKLVGAKQYVDALEALKENLSKGTLLNPYSDDAKLRMTLFNDAVAKGRSARDLGVSNANLNLEHGAFSGPGVLGQGTKMITPQQIDTMINDAKTKAEDSLRVLRPLRGEGSVNTGFGGAAPKMVTIKNNKTGETKQVSEDEARKLGAIK